MTSHLVSFGIGYATDRFLDYNANSPYMFGGGYESAYNRPSLLGYFKHGGEVKKTGLYGVHRQEMVIPAKDVAKTKKALKAAKVSISNGKKKGGCGHK